MSDVLPPHDLTCPISKDLMNDPVSVTHHGVDYTFDRVCLDTWKTTPGGDQNPLTMLSGFREAICKPNQDVMERVFEFRKTHGMDTDVDTEKIKLEPFSDYQQIQDDEAEARRLDIELNGIAVPPPRILQVHIRGQDGIETRNVYVPSSLCLLYDRIPEMRGYLMRLFVSHAMTLEDGEREGSIVTEPSVSGQEPQTDIVQQGLYEDQSQRIFSGPSFSEAHSDLESVLASRSEPTMEPVSDTVIEPPETGFAGMRMGFLN